MSADEFTPTDQQMRDWIVMVDTICGHGGESMARQERWLLEHDERVRREAAAEQRERDAQIVRLYVGGDWGLPERAEILAAAIREAA